MTVPGVSVVQTVDKYTGGHTGTRPQVGRHCQLPVGQGGVELGLRAVGGQGVRGQHPGGLWLRGQTGRGEEEKYQDQSPHLGLSDTAEN